jgi:radical SAM superfamily enzyme YgiQ (UPF0313 family)
MSSKLKILLYDASAIRHEYNDPLSIETLAGFLEQKKTLVDVDCKSYATDGPLDTQDISSYHLIGVSLPYNSIGTLKNIYNKINFSDGQLLLVGNSLSTFGYREILEKFPKTICSLGEGEYAILDLINFVQKKKKLSEVRNIAYTQEKNIITNPRTVIAAADISAPVRNEKTIDFLKSNKGTFRIEASRGCNYGICTFCYLPGKYPSKFRREVSLTQIMDQIYELDKMGVKTPYFTDEDFIGKNFVRAKEIADQISSDKKSGKISSDMSFYINISASDVINQKWQELAPALLKAGINQVFVGIESGCDSQLKRFRKNTTVSNNIKCLNMLEKSGFKPEVGFIFFDPFSNVDELKSSLDFIGKTKLYNHRVYLFNPLLVTHLSQYHQMSVDKKIKLKSLDLDTLSYDYKFPDPSVQKIWDTFSGWRKDVDEKFYAYQLQTRGESNDRDSENRLKTLNYLEYRIMKNLVKHIDSGIPEYKTSYEKYMQLYEKSLLPSQKINRIQRVITDTQKSITD